MSFQLLSPKDRRSNLWVFHQQHSRQPLQVRTELSDLVCANCGKFDESAALERLAGQTRIRATEDFLLSDDGVICIHDRLVELWLKLQVKPPQFVRLLEGQPYSAVKAAAHSVFADEPGPDQRVLGPDQIIRAAKQDYPLEFDDTNRCISCRRYCQVLGFVNTEAVAEQCPQSTVAVVSAGLCEQWWGRMLWLYATDTVATAMKEAKVRGVEYGRRTT